MNFCNGQYSNLPKGLAGRIHQLRLKKFRDERDMFVAEGTKCVGDTLGHFEIVCLVATRHWLENHPTPTGKTYLADTSQMRYISSLSSAPEVVAVYKRPSHTLDKDLVTHDLTLMLEGVQDPGNLGTIIRLCDWFGIRQVIASKDCADIFGAKAVQSTMGSISRVHVFYLNLEDFIAANPSVPVAGLLLDGENIYSAKLPVPCIVAMGNEGRGLSAELRDILSLRLLIPSYPPNEATAESLNVAMATSIALSEFRRR